jgi:hypothetical protein
LKFNVRDQRALHSPVTRARRGRTWVGAHPRYASVCSTATDVPLRLRSSRHSACAPLFRPPNRKPNRVAKVILPLSETITRDKTNCASAVCCARGSGVQLYVAGWRVNLLLASSGCAPDCTRQPTTKICF